MTSLALRRLTSLATVLVAVSLVPAPAQAALERVGPNDPVTTLPVWFQDTTGITFELCTPLVQAELDGGHCLLLPGDTVAPEVFPGQFFDEHFYWGADVVGDYTYVPPVGVTPPFTTGRVVYVQAIEAAFLTGVAPGGADMFGRVRFRLDDLPLDGNYTFYTPYGIEVIAGLAGDRIFFTEDIGCPYPNYECVLPTRIGPFLLPSAFPGGPEQAPIDGPVPGKKYIADPGVTHKVTGSPIVGNYTLTNGSQVNPNGLYIEAPDGQLIFSSTDFSLMGRYYSEVIPSRVVVDRASYTRDASSVAVDTYATGEPTMVPRLSGAALTPPVQPELSFYPAPCAGTGPFTAPVGETAIPMARNGNVYWADTAPAAVPAGICLADLNARNALGATVPVYVPGVLGDQVFVAEALYDPSNGGSLSVVAASSDQVGLPGLAVAAFGDLASNVALVNGLAYITPLVAPPAKVRVLSAEQGVAELQVVVGKRSASGVTLSANLGSPQPPGVPVTFTAQGQGASGYLYRFSVDSGGGFAVVQDWSPTATWTLSGATPPGSYQVQAEVWLGLTPTPPDAVSAAIPFVINVIPASGVTLASDLPSPQSPGTAVTFTATGAGSTSPYSYRFWLNDGSAWTMVQDWSLVATWTLASSTPAGNYRVLAQVRTSPAVTLDATSAEFPMAISLPAATGVTLTPSVASPQLLGTTVVWTAAGQGSTAPYSYRFWFNVGGVWSVIQDWSAVATWTMPDTTPAGAYQVTVEVRTSTTVVRDAVSPTAMYTITAPVTPPATGVTLTPDLASPQLPGTAVTWTAAGQGSTAPYSYRFWLNAGGVWSVIQDWSAVATWTMPDTTPAGSYQVSVEVRTSTTVTRDAVAPTALFTLATPVTPPATGVTLSPDLASPRTEGTAVTWTAAGQGSTAAYSYRFWFNAGGVWSVIQDWSPVATWTMPGTTLAGSYQVTVEVRTTTTVTRDAVAPNAIYTILAPVTPPATGVTLGSDLASPQAFGTAVLWTAAGQGSTAAYSYRFWFSTGGVWTMVQDWSLTDTWTQPDTALVGTHQVAVEVRTTTAVARDAISPFSDFVVQ